MKTAEFKKMLLDITSNQGLDILHQSISQIEYSEPIRVAFLGEFSTGKSTLVNALLREKLIPMFDEPTSANPVEVFPAKENKFKVAHWDANKEQIKEIDKDQLIEEIMKYESGKRIKIYLKDTEALNNDVVLVDTPGISSIVDHHTQVTYGYLPIVDAAVFVISALPGEATASILEFVEKEISTIPGLKDRLFFCVTMLDTIPMADRDRVYRQIKESIEKVVPQTRIVALSPKQILDHAVNNDYDSYNQSGIGELLKFIQVELPARKVEVMDDKLCKHLTGLKETVIKQLEAKRISLDYSTPELDKEIDLAQAQIDDLNRKLSQLDQDVQKAKESIQTQIKFKQEALVDAIAFKASQDQDFLADIQAFSESAKEIIVRNCSRIDIPSRTEHMNLGDIINHRLSPMISTIKQIMNLCANAITMVVTAMLIPGKTYLDASGAAAVATQVVGKEAAKEVAQKAAKHALVKASFIKFVSYVGKVVDEINPIETVKDIVSLPILKATIKSKLQSVISQVIEQVFEIIQDNIDIYTKDNITDPIMQHKATLLKTRKDKAESAEEKESIFRVITEDIKLLNSNNC